MLPNFTVVICGAVLTVIMLAVTGFGLIMPETRTRIGEMPEVGRPMMQHMIAEPPAQAQFAVLDLSRRADELGRLRDLVPPAPVAEPAPAVKEDEPAQDVAQGTAEETVREATHGTARETGQAPDAADPSDTPAAPAIATAPVAAAIPAAAPVIVAAVAPAAPPSTPAKEEDPKTAADPPTADLRDPAEADSIEAMIPGAEAGPQSVAALAETAEVAPTLRVGGRVNVRLPRGKRGARATVVVKKPARHTARRPHRHARRAYAVQSSPPNPFGLPGTQYR